MPKEWATLADKAGGVAELAEALGVTKVTLWRWSKGEPISRTARMVLATWCAMHGQKMPETRLSGEKRPAQKKD